MTLNPESTSRHDIDTNRRFIAIFDHPDNAELTRSFTVGLAINDAPRPADPAATPAPSASSPRRRVEKDAIRYTDADDDILLIRRVDNAEKKWHGFLFTIAGHKVFMADDVDGDAVVEWLRRRFGGGK